MWQYDFSSEKHNWKTSKHRKERETQGEAGSRDGNHTQGAAQGTGGGGVEGQHGTEETVGTAGTSGGIGEETLGTSGAHRWGATLSTGTTSGLLGAGVDTVTTASARHSRRRRRVSGARHSWGAVGFESHPRDAECSANAARTAAE